jgi:hypothetical protein
MPICVSVTDMVTFFDFEVFAFLLAANDAFIPSMQKQSIAAMVPTKQRFNTNFFISSPFTEQQFSYTSEITVRLLTFYTILNLLQIENYNLIIAF